MDSNRRAFALAAALVTLVALCWVLLTPPGAGPDEPAHLVRSGAIISFQYNGTPTGSIGEEAFLLRDSYRVPEPACYAFIANRDRSVNCAAPVDYTDAMMPLPTRADEYPIWGHLTFGVGTLLPVVPDVWWGRLVGAGVAVAMLGWCWAATDTALGRAGLLAAATPMVWGTFALVNPSSFTIAGGFGLWTGLATVLPRATDPASRTRTDSHADIGVADGGRDDRRSDWLVAVGWTLLTLPRRDGILWASLVVALMLVFSGYSLRDLVVRLRTGPRVLIAGSLLGPLLYAILEPSRLAIAALFAPLVMVVADRVVAAWWRWPARRSRTLLSIGVAVGGLGAVLGVAVQRPGGWDGTVARFVLESYDVHLREAIGVLGWLDTPLPDFAYLIVVVMLGVLGGVALTVRPSRAAAAVGVVVVAVVVAWLLEMLSGATYGRYWQGRYSLPLLVGVPIVLTSLPVVGEFGRRLAIGVSAAAMFVTNVGAWAAARRWSVGVDGSLVPWDWRNVHEVIPAFILLVVMAASSAGLVWLVYRSPSQAAPAGDRYRTLSSR